MSALSLPPTPTTRTAATPDARRAAGRGHLRVVPDPAPRWSLAPTGPLQAWRRRLGVAALLVALLALAVALTVEVAAGPSTAAPATVPVSTATVVVEPGQTLWDVAVAHAPADVPTGVYVDELVALNGLTGGGVDAWQVLRLP